MVRVLTQHSETIHDFVVDTLKTGMGDPRMILYGINKCIVKGVTSNMTSHSLSVIRTTWFHNP